MRANRTSWAGTSQVQARDVPLQLSMVAGVSVLVLVSGVPVLCNYLLLPQVRYPLVWGVGVRNVFYGTVSMSVLYFFSYIAGNTMYQLLNPHQQCLVLFVDLLLHHNRLYSSASDSISMGYTAIPQHHNTLHHINYLYPQSSVPSFVHLPPSPPQQIIFQFIRFYIYWLYLQPPTS